MISKVENPYYVKAFSDKSSTKEKGEEAESSETTFLEVKISSKESFFEETSSEESSVEDISS